MRAFAPCTVFTALSLVGLLPSAHAITWSGDVSPNPTTWTSSTNGYVGNTGTGVVTVDPTAGLLSNTSYLGYTATGNGIYVTCARGDATWSDMPVLDDGYAGSGTLSISNGGTVSCTAAYLGQNGGTGAILIDGAGSKLTTSANTYLGSYTNGNNGSGTVTVTNGGI